VAIDGPDGAGKTTFSRDLDDALRPVLGDSAEVHRFSADHLLIPLSLRRSEQAIDPRWLYEHIYDWEQIRAIVAGDPGFDARSSVLLVDGMTLQRPELADLWDVTVYLTVPEEVTVQRILARNTTLEEPDSAIEARYTERYLPAQRTYVDAVDPLSSSDIVLEMSEPERPTVLRWGRPR
jgi:uridine kinase